MWVHVIRDKSDAFATFKKFKALIEKGIGHKVKILRTDRGGEYLSKLFASFCEEEGIDRHLTAPYSPGQNGVVERRNRTVMSTARSLHKGMELPGKMWERLPAMLCIY